MAANPLKNVILMEEIVRFLCLAKTNRFTVTGRIKMHRGWTKQERGILWSTGWASCGLSASGWKLFDQQPAVLGQQAYADF